MPGPSILRASLESPPPGIPGKNMQQPLDSGCGGQKFSLLSLELGVTENPTYTQPPLVGRPQVGVLKLGGVPGFWVTGLEVSESGSTYAPTDLDPRWISLSSPSDRIGGDSTGHPLVYPDF